jgi:hypothetical protein
MTTITSNEAWEAIYSRYQNLLQIDRALLAGVISPAQEEVWEEAHDQTAEAIAELINTPAQTLSQALAKLRVVIRHGHLDGVSDNLDDPEVRTEALSDSMRDGPWPLLRVLEDLERLERSGSPELAAAALTVTDFEQQEQAGLEEAHRLETAGEWDRNVVTARLSALDRRLAEAVQIALKVRSSALADHRHKAVVLQAVLSSGMFSAQGFSDEELALMKSLCSDLIGSTT